MNDILSMTVSADHEQVTVAMTQEHGVTTLLLSAEEARMLGRDLLRAADEHETMQQAQGGAA